MKAGLSSRTMEKNHLSWSMVQTGPKSQVIPLVKIGLLNYLKNLEVIIISPYTLQCKLSTQVLQCTTLHEYIDT